MCASQNTPVNVYTVLACVWYTWLIADTIIGLISQYKVDFHMQCCCLWDINWLIFVSQTDIILVLIPILTVTSRQFMIIFVMLG
jgi:hypothetical protein